MLCYAYAYAYAYAMLCLCYATLMLGQRFVIITQYDN